MSSQGSVEALDPATAESFIKTLFSDLDGFFELRLISSRDGRRLQRFFPITKVLSDFRGLHATLLAANQGGANIYFGVNPRDREDGTAAAITRCRVLWADVDRKNVEDLPAKFNPLIEQGLAPSFVVETGHGVHAYWILRDLHKPADCEKAMSALAYHLGGDRVWDAPRILRMPATMNMKGAPVPCNVLKATGKTYNLSDFDPVIAAAPAEILKPPVAPGAPGGNGHSGNGVISAIAKSIAEFWTDGKRHSLAMAAAGMMRQAEMGRPAVEAVIKQVMQMTGDTEVEDRIKAVETSFTPGKTIAGTQLARETLGDQAEKFLRGIRAALRLVPPAPVTRKKFPVFEAASCIPISANEHRTFFEQYLAWAFEQTDAPLQFHIGASLTLAAAALGNKVWTGYPRPGGKLKTYPTLYTMLAGKTSRYRKSTSISLARSLMKAVDLPIYPNNATPEQLFSRMAPNVAEVEEVTDKKGNTKEIPVAWEGSPWGVMFHPEFSALLAAAKKSYMTDILSLYMDMYDGSADAMTSSRETKTAGRFYITSPAISMLVGVTPVGLRDHLQKTSMADGFMTRFFFMLPSPDHQTRFDLTSIDPNIETVQFAALCDELNLLAKLQGEMLPDEGAATILGGFNREIDQRIAAFEAEGQEYMDALIGRLPSMAVKIAMIYSCALGTFPAISEVPTALAVTLCRYVADTAETFYVQTHPEDKSNREAAYVEKLLDVIRRIVAATPGAIARRALMRRSHLEMVQFDRAIATLVEQGRIIERKNQIGGVAYVLNETEE